MLLFEKSFATPGCGGACSEQRPATSHLGLALCKQHPLPVPPQFVLCLEQKSETHRLLDFYVVEGKL